MRDRYIAAWPALTRWTPDQLAGAFGGLEIEALIDLPAHGVLYPRDQDTYLRKMTFAEFAARMVTTPSTRPCYLAYARLAEVLAQRRDEVGRARVFGHVLHDDGRGRGTVRELRAAWRR